MSVFSHYPLQKALYQTLSSDSSLMALVTGIFDHVPQAAVMPYITLGNAAGHDWSSKTSQGMEQQPVIHIWSRNGGRKETALIMERIHTLLHDAAITVVGQNLVSLRFVSSDIMLKDDGYTYQGQMRFRALLEAA